MSEENQNQEQSSKPKFSAKDLGKKAGALAIAPVKLVLKLMSKTLKLVIWNPITIGALMFLIGARVHETGRLAGHFGKDYKGATVRLSSGSCMLKGKPRQLALVQDQVKITYIDAEKIQAVILKTREVVDCKTSEAVIDTLALQDLLGKENQAIPELMAQNEVVERVPEYKSLEKKTLIMSGSCVDLNEKVLPAFTDEKVDVTSVIGDKENPEVFTLTGILKRPDVAPQPVRCLSTAIKYSEYNTVAAKQIEGMDLNIAETQAKSYVGEVLIITGTCFPDERTKINKTKKYAFYKLANSKVQVLEHDMTKEGKINRLVGIALDDQFRGDALYCDKVKFPFTFKEFDEDTIKLEKGTTAEQIAPVNEAAPVVTPEPVVNQ
jgi:hypothetical protein